MRVADRRHTLALLASILLLSAPQFVLAQSCSMTFDKNPVLPGEGTTLRWSLHVTFLWMLDANQTTQFYISPIGRMWANQFNLLTGVLSNSVWVAPMTTTEYVGTMPNNNPFKPVATCAATLTVVQQPTAAVVPLRPPAVTVLEPTCAVTFDKNPIDQGQSTTIHWTSSNSKLFYINGIGYVGASGSASVKPKQTANYSGYVSDDSANTASCPASLQVSGEPICTPEQILQDGVCVARAAQCPVGYVKRGTECVFSACPIGYTLQGTACIFAACPSGYVLQGTQCVQRGRQCTAQPYCEGASIVDGCTGDVLQACDWGCFYGRCNEVPKPSASLKAVPSLVHSGNTTSVSWTSTNTTSCTVTSTNGDSWSALSSTGNTSLAIKAQTIFTLQCKGYAGANPSSVQKSVTVNVAPAYQEK